MVISPFDPTSMHAGLNESVLGPEGFVKQGIHSNKNAFPMLRPVDLKFSKSGDFRLFVEKNRENLAKNRGIPAICQIYRKQTFRNESFWTNS